MDDALQQLGFAWQERQRSVMLAVFQQRGSVARQLCERVLKQPPACV